MRHLCLPHTLDGLRDTNVIRLELIETNGSGEGQQTQEPEAAVVGLWDTADGEVVDD